MKINAVLKTLLYRPIEVIEALLVISFVSLGIWYILPWTHTEQVSSARITHNPAIPMVLSWVHLLVGSLWGYFLVHKYRRWSWKFRQFASQLMFVLYMFYAFSQVILWGSTRVSFIHTFTVGIVAGIIYLNLRRIESEDEDN